MHDHDCGHKKCKELKASGEALCKKLVTTCLTHFGVKEEDIMAQDDAYVACLAALSIVGGTLGKSGINPPAAIELMLKTAAHAYQGELVVGGGPLGDDTSPYSGSRMGFGFGHKPNKNEIN